MSDDPVTIDWLHATAPWGTHFYRNRVEIPLERGDAVGRWFLYLGPLKYGRRRAELCGETTVPPIRTVSLPLPPIESRAELIHRYVELANDLWPKPKPHGG